MKQRIQLEFSVVVMVDVETARCDGELTPGSGIIFNPVKFAQEFVTLATQINGSHSQVLNGKIVNRLEVVDKDVRLVGGFIN